jgi:hypothetical protein
MKMAIWHLTPVDLDDPSWEASSHRGAAIIRAESEDAAREIAQQAFGVKTRFPPQHRIVSTPWKRAELVRAEHVSDARFEEEGPAQVLFPSGFEANLKARSPGR